jgi:hypothetical protein
MQLRFSGIRILGVTALAGLASSAWAGNLAPIGLPTLDEFALFGLAAAVGIAGAVAVFRRRK